MLPKVEVGARIATNMGPLNEVWLGISPAEADEVSILRTSEYREPRNSGISSGSSP